MRVNHQPLPFLGCVKHHFYVFMDRFGEKLRTLRKRRGFTQGQMGELLEVSYPYVAKLERGEKMPDAPMILKITNIFG